MSGLKLTRVKVGGLEIQVFLRILEKYIFVG